MPTPRARRLGRAFFARPTLVVARQLLGKVLVHGKRAARIVEVEAYIGDDPASHARMGPTRRNVPMFKAGGRSYVYFIYGMYHCFNISTERAGKGAAILLRGAEPLTGFGGPAPRLAGPGVLCRAFGFTTAHTDLDLARGPIALLDAPPVPRQLVGRSARLGVADDRPWRFYVRGSPGVSGPPGLRL